MLGEQKNKLASQKQRFVVTQWYNIKRVGSLHKMILQPISDGVGMLREEVSVSTDPHLVRPRANSTIQIAKTNWSVYRSKRIRFKFLTRTQFILLNVLL